MLGIGAPAWNEPVELVRVFVGGRMASPVFGWVMVGSFVPGRVCRSRDYRITVGSSERRREEEARFSSPRGGGESSRAAGKKTMQQGVGPGAC